MVDKIGRDLMAGAIRTGWCVPPRPLSLLIPLIAPDKGRKDPCSRKTIGSHRYGQVN